MIKKFAVLALSLLPLLLCGGNLSLSLDLSGFDPSAGELPSGWGALTAPGQFRLPVRPVNVIIPANAVNLQYNWQFSGARSLAAPAPGINPAFTDGQRVLFSAAQTPDAPLLRFRGIGKWGDVSSANFSALPAVWNGNSWQAYSTLSLELSWEEAPETLPSRIPPVLEQPDKNGTCPANSFYANPADLAKYYSRSDAKLYDILLITNSALYPYTEPLNIYHQSLGLITGFANISNILASSPGATNGEKLRNYIAGQYNSSPFTYVLLVGDYDTVPVMYLTPEPDGYETVASDFFYGDLSSIVDTDSDGRLGEYSSGEGIQDYLCDFTPEAFVGRISTNNPTTLQQIILRTIAYNNSNAPWKQSALLPAAFLNYGGEPEPIYLQTDGATFSEYARQTVLSDWQVTTMYEQIGYVPAYPSTVPLDYNGLKDLLSTTSYGILNWSAHGSSGSSSRKVWMNDDNANSLPDSWEMQWMDMVDRQSFDNLANQDGTILFAASCYNGYIDNQSQSLAEYALQKKAVTSVGATRTGWYKIGWDNPGWGGLSSYNLHWLENITRNGLSTGAAIAYANLTHAQYYMFGDPVDAGGIIWPELQNVYTYINYGSPLVNHSPSQPAPQGEILVYEPFHRNGLGVVNALNAAGRFNVVYTDKIIPDYSYLDGFEAVFCLFGWGDTAYILEPGNLDYNMLNAYLDNGGKVYLEGDVGWDPADPFWGKFGTHAPLDVIAFIEAVSYTQGATTLVWGYDQTDNQTYVPLANAPTASPIFSSQNTVYANNSLAIFNDTDTHKTVASAFALSAILPGNNDLSDLLRKILIAFEVIDPDPSSGDDPLVPALSGQPRNYPNPFADNTMLQFKLDRPATLRLEIFNQRGQKVRTLAPAGFGKGEHELLWDGLDDAGRSLSRGIYLWRLSGGGTESRGKMLKL